MTSTSSPAAQAAETAAALFNSPDGGVGSEPVPVLTYSAGADRLARPEALRPVYEAMAERAPDHQVAGG
ncbi:hypothetical protein ACFWJW_08630 [Streptomyces sp. NPDC127097]|uniref:hypothetical protein n=1 Tax=Streptomyces sp. NPDC127097 TaxID=3347136 RepID=UPI00365CBE02